VIRLAFPSAQILPASPSTREKVDEQLVFSFMWDPLPEQAVRHDVDK
jgi:hypothetical protein